MDIPVASALVSSAGNVAGTAVNFALNSRSQEKAQNYQSDMFQSRYQMTVNDLKAAGLNPMLAYTQGVGGAPSSSAVSSGGSSMGSDAVDSYNSSRIASAQAALLAAQTKSASLDADMKGPQAEIMKGVLKLLKRWTGSSAYQQKGPDRSKLDAIGGLPGSQGPPMFEGPVKKFFKNLFKGGN